MGEWKKVKLKDVLIEGSKERVDDTSKYQKLTIKLNFKGMEKSKVREKMADRRPFYIRKKGEIVIGKQNYFNGSIAILPDELDGGICSNAIMSFKTKKEYNNKYIYYLLSDTSFINRRSYLANGTGQKELSEKDFLNFEVLIPNIEEQVKIVKILERVDLIIEKYQYLLKKKCEFVKAQFDGMFASIGEKISLAEISQRITDGSHNPPKGEKNDTGYYMLSSQNIENGTISYENIRFLNKKDFEKENKRTMLEKGDILFSIVGSIGKTAIFQDDKKVTFQRSVAIIKCNNSINKKFLEYSLLSNDIKKQVYIMAKGGAQEGIYLEDLKKIKIKNVNLEKQNQFAKIIEIAEKQKIELEKIIENYKKLKKGLMQQLLTEKI